MTRKVLLRAFFGDCLPPSESPAFTFADPSPKGGRIMPNIIRSERR